MKKKAPRKVRRPKQVSKPRAISKRKSMARSAAPVTLDSLLTPIAGADRRDMQARPSTSSAPATGASSASCIRAAFDGRRT